MPVAQYTPTKTPVLHALLWTGNEVDLAELPGLDQNDVSFWVEEDGVLCINNLDEPNHVARPNQDYLVRGVTGYFFTVEKEKFEHEYVPREVLERRPMWTPEQARNVLGDPVDFPRRDQGICWVEYDRAANLCERIIGHYETQLNIAALAFEQIQSKSLAMPLLDWSKAPEWAQWWAVDADGSASWYGLEPLMYETMSFCGWTRPVINGVQQGRTEDSNYIDIPLGIDWRTLKQQRPESA